MAHKSIRPNVILITVDCLRPDHLGCYGYARNTSPFVDSLAREGLLYEQAFSHGGGTPESFPSLLSGVYPPTSERQYGHMHALEGTIAELMLARGYRTAAFHSNPYLSRFFSYNLGFEEFFDNLPLAKAQNRSILARTLESSALSKFLNLAIRRHLPIKNAEEISSMALDWLRATNEQFFIWLHYMDLHQPSLPPPRYFDTLGIEKMHYLQMLNTIRNFRESTDGLRGSNIQRIRDIYDCAIRYVDSQIHSLCDGLIDRNAFDNCIVLFSSDHGESLGEHNRLGHGSVYDEIIHVPLVFHGPGVLPDRRKMLVTTMGIKSSLANLSAGDSRNLNSVLRKGLVNPVSEGIISVANNYPIGRLVISVRSQKWKFIQTRYKESNSTKEELFDVEADPNEVKNVIGTHPIASKMYPRIIQAYIDYSIRRAPS